MSGLKRQNSDEDDCGNVCSGQDMPSPLDPSQMNLAFNAHPEMLDDDGKPKSKIPRRASIDSKKIRNDCEKQRRDRLNAYIGELARLVPVVTTATRRIDKSSILRLAVNYLQVHHDLIKPSNQGSFRQWRPEFLKYNLGNVLLESLDGFMLVISRKGILNFATHAVTTLLGLKLVDILGNSIYNIVHPQDHEHLAKQLVEDDEDDDSEYGASEGQAAAGEDAVIHGHRAFTVRMLNMHHRQSARYETVVIRGLLKKVPPVHPSMPQCVAEAEIVLVGVAKLADEKPRELYPAIDPNASQWFTWHVLNGTISYSDPRGAWLTGFQPRESLGFSPYQLLHKDDIPYVVCVHNQFVKEGSVPETVFRMYTKSRELLYIKTTTQLIRDRWTSAPKMIVSINDVLDVEKGTAMLADQKARLKALNEATANLDLNSPTSPERETQQNRLPQWKRSPQVLDDKESRVSEAGDCSSDEEELVQIKEDKDTVYIVSGASELSIDLSGETLKKTSQKGGIVVDSTDDIIGEMTLVPPKFIGDEDESPAMSPRPMQSCNIRSSDFSPGSAPGAFRNLTTSSPPGTGSYGSLHGSQYPDSDGEPGAAGPSSSNSQSPEWCAQQVRTPRRSHSIGSHRTSLGHTGEMGAEKRKQNPLLFGLLSKNPAGNEQARTSASCVPSHYTTPGTRVSTSTEGDSESPLPECVNTKDSSLSFEDLATQAVQVSSNLSQMYQHQQKPVTMSNGSPPSCQDGPCDHMNFTTADLSSSPLNQDYLDVSLNSPQQPNNRPYSFAEDRGNVVASDDDRFSMDVGMSGNFDSWRGGEHAFSRRSSHSSSVGQPSPGTPTTTTAVAPASCPDPAAVPPSSMYSPQASSKPSSRYFFSASTSSPERQQQLQYGFSSQGSSQQSSHFNLESIELPFALGTTSSMPTVSSGGSAISDISDNLLDCLPGPVNSSYGGYPSHPQVVGHSMSPTAPSMMPGSWHSPSPAVTVSLGNKCPGNGRVDSAEYPGIFASRPHVVAERGTNIASCSMVGSSTAQAPYRNGGTLAVRQNGVQPSPTSMNVCPPLVPGTSQHNTASHTNSYLQQQQQQQQQKHQLHRHHQQPLLPTQTEQGQGDSCGLGYNTWDMWS